MKNIAKISLLLASFTLIQSALALEKQAVLTIQNMVCESCPIIVKKSLERVEGVKKVSVSYKGKTATITYENEKAKVSDLIKATTDAGYPSEEAGSKKDAIK